MNVDDEDRVSRPQAFPAVFLRLGSDEVIAEVQGVDAADDRVRRLFTPAFDRELSALVAPADRAALRAALDRARRGDPVAPLAVRWCAADAAGHPVELIFFDGGASPPGPLRAVVRDLAPSERAEQALRQSETRLSLLYQHVEDVVFLLQVEDGDYRFVSVNPAFLRATGLERGQVVGKPVREVIPEPSLSTVLAKYTEALRTRKTVRWQETTPYPSGTKHGDVAVTPVLDARGEATLLIGSVRDITEHKRAEDEIRQREELLRGVIDAMPVGVGIWRRDGRLRYVNQRAVEISGRPFLAEQTHAEAAATYRILKAGTDEPYPPAQLPTSRALAGEPARIDDAEFLLPDGRRRPVEAWSAPLRDAKGDVTAAVTVFADATERRRGEALRAGERRVLELVGAGAPIEEALEALARVVEEQADGMRVSILLLVGDRVRHGAAPSLPPEWVRHVDGQAIGPNRGSCGTAAYTRQRVIAADIATDPRWVDFREAALGYGLRSCWSTPVLARDGSVLGTFALYYGEPREPTARQLDLIERAGHVAAIAIERQQAQDALRHLNEQLEARVHERTAELERAMAAARESEETFRSVTSAAQSAIVMIDDEGRVTLWSPAAERILGWTEAEVQGRELASFLVPPAYAGRHRAALAEFRNSGQGALLGKLSEVPALRADGSQIPVELSLSSVQVRGRWCAIGIMNDISARVEAARSLGYRSAFQRLLLETSSRFVALTRDQIDREIEAALERIAGFCRVSSGYIFRFGEDGREFSMTHLWRDGRLKTDPNRLRSLRTDSMPWWMGQIRAGTVVAVPSVEELPDAAAVEKAILAPQGVRSVLDVPMHYEGTVVGFLGLASSESPRRWSDDEIALLTLTGQVFTHALKRKEVESALVSAREAAEAANRATELAMSAGSMAAWDYDSRRGMMRWSQGVAAIFLTTPEEFDGSYDSFMALVHPDDREEVDAWTKGALANPHGEVYEVEHRTARTDERGEHRHVYGRWRVTRDAEGRPTGTAGIVMDVTSRMQHERDLRHAREAADAANNAKSRFLANMSHEIRTPMNAILGFAQLLQRDTTLTAGQRKRVDAIARSGDHLLALINEVLDMAKIEAGETQLFPTTFAFAKVLGGLDAMFRGRAAEKGLRFRVEATGVRAYLRTDEVKLTQVLVNLLGNAIKFTDHGEVGLRVSMLSEDRNPRLIAEVSDTGPGIAASERELVFETFSQTEAGRARGGTGLGLPLAREYARMMGGDLTFESEPGKGSCFRLEVQVGIGDEADLPKPASLRRVVGLAAGQGSVRVLVADDSPDNRVLLIALLKSVGFDVRDARDGAEAVALSEQWQPQLVLMDLRMPVMDGAAATRAIREAPWGRAIKIVMVSASAFPQDRDAAADCGAHGFVRKPFTEGHIFGAVQEALGVRYLFEGEAGAEPAAEAAGDVPGLAELAAALPHGVVEALERAVLRGDSEELAGLIDRLPGRESLAAELRRLARGYDYERILGLLKR